MVTKQGVVTPGGWASRQIESGNPFAAGRKHGKLCKSDLADLFPGVKTAIAEKSRDDAGFDFCDASVCIAAQDPGLWQAIEQMHRRRPAIRKPRATGFTGIGIKKGGHESQILTTHADTGCATKLVILRL
jgi:hypothetical protein